jgi:hypothetical protein
MAHFAELDNTNTVTRVIVVNNNNILDDNGIESEEIGKQFCQQFGEGPWVQTSYNFNFRKNYASIGGIYDPVRDAFIPPKIYPDSVFDEESCRWVIPAPDR